MLYILRKREEVVTYFSFGIILPWTATTLAREDGIDSDTALAYAVLRESSSRLAAEASESGLVEFVQMF